MWIESHQSIKNHPKIKKAARIAGVNEYEMIGRVHCLWWWAIDYAPDGNITKYNADDIEGAMDWQGQPGQLYRALVECGFNGHCGLIEIVGDEIRIHDWYDYGGKLLEKREANAERMRERRALHVQNTTIARRGATEQTEQTEQTEHSKGANKPRTTAKETCPQEWMTALYDITSTDIATASVMQRKSISDCGKVLSKTGAPPAALDVFRSNWYKLDWRGKQGQPPTVKQVRDEWGKYSKVSTNGNGHTEDVIDDNPKQYGWLPNGTKVEIKK